MPRGRSPLQRRVRRPEVTRRRYPRNLYLTFSHINSATMTLPSMPLGCGLVVM